MVHARKFRLILASASPRRAEILRRAGFRFETRPAMVDETVRAEEAPAEHVRRLAREKALTGAMQLSGPAVVVGADTVVVAGGEILGKPTSRSDARRMLRLLSGRTHAVLTGLALLRLPRRSRRCPALSGATLRSAVESTRVTFAPLSAREIAAYLASGEPMGKAGAYAIQGRGGKFVTRIEGCYCNVVGLPLARLYSMLRKAGLENISRKYKRRPKPSGRRRKR
jgi:nucleoside triphosphate pyrophosphatase